MEVTGRDVTDGHLLNLTAYWRFLRQYIIHNIIIKRLFSKLEQLKFLPMNTNGKCCLLGIEQYLAARQLPLNAA